MTPNFSFQESCCRYTGVFNIPPKKSTQLLLIWFGNLRGFKLSMHPLFSEFAWGITMKASKPKFGKSKAELGSSFLLLLLQMT